MSGKEAEAFKKADRNIFPGDVRESPADYQDTMVAWTGIIIKREFIKHEDWTEARYTLEHHYYNWIENTGFEDERLYLSQRGEGLFQASWRIEKKGRFNKIKKSARAGSLLIVYGIPGQVSEDGIIVLTSKHMRAFNKKYISTDMQDYGRPQQPEKTDESRQASALK